MSAVVRLTAGDDDVHFSDVVGKLLIDPHSDELICVTVQIEVYSMNIGRHEE